MNQKNRNLSIRMKGKDVEDLQESLRLLEFTIEDKKGYFGKTTHQAVVEFQKTHKLEPTGIVDDHTAAKIDEAVDALPSRPDIDIKKRYLVQGTLLQPDGSPVINTIVKAFDKELRQEKLLGEDKTDKNGKYSIYYTILYLGGSEKRFADLIVRAYNQRGKEIATSPLILHASPRQTVNLILGNEPYIGPSEYTQIGTKLMPLLRDVKPFQLTEEDITYLASKTGLDPILISYFVQSARLAQESDIPAEVFYGLFRQNLPTSFPALLIQDPEVFRRALESAVRDNIISSRFEKLIDTMLKKLQAQLIEHALKGPQKRGESSFSDLLKIASLSEDKQRIFLQAYLPYKGPRDVFWNRIRAHSAFGSECVEALQTTMQLAALTRNHLPLIEVLQEKQRTGEINALRDLAQYNQENWITLIESTGLPDSVPGANREEKIKNYAKIMMQTIEDAFPTAVIEHCIKSGDFSHAGSVKDFLKENPEFEFRTMRIDSYLDQFENARFASNEEVVKDSLRKMQRLFNITPRYNKYDAIRTLMGDELTSAHAIRRIGKSAFVNKYAQHFGSQQTQQIYASASQTAAEAVMLFAEYGSGMNIIDVRVLPTTTSRIPEWEHLFGSLDLCECEHCRSVYSPAAYLVDIMHFLSNCGEGRTALDALFTRETGNGEVNRRIDIEKIELTCKNTNTVVPYVDIVNEILENVIARTDTVYQTEGTEEELRVYPEHLNLAAYDELKEAFYPWSLPFDLWAEEARMYLGHLGVPRHELMKQFSREETEGTPTEYDIASEHLGLTPKDREIIIGVAQVQPYEFWGIDSSNWVNELKTVSTFLEKSGLSYKELQQLLCTRFINPDGEIEIKFSESTCNPDKTTIEGLTDDALEDALDRIHRFVRLQRKLNWSICELDAALHVLSPNDLGPDFLVSLSHVKHLLDTLKVPLIEMLSWWANIDTHSCGDEPSLYEKVFLSKTVTTLADIFKLNAAGDELVNTNHTIRDSVLPLLATLHISSDELTLLANKGLSNYMESILNLANLSALYRRVSLAKALKLSISDFLSLSFLSGINPFDPSNIAETIRFVEVVKQVRASGFSVEELSYLLCNYYQPNSAVAPSEEQIALFLGELRSGLQKIEQEYSSISDPTGEKTAQALAVLLSEEDAKDALAIVDGTCKKGVGEQKNFVEDHFAGILKSEDTIAKLVEPNTMIPVNEKEERFTYVAKLLLTYLQQEAYVKQKIADALDLTIEASELLLCEFVPSHLDDNEKAITDFLKPYFVNSDGDPLTAEKFPEQFCRFWLLDKIATVITRFNIPSEELELLFGRNLGLGWPNLNGLPLEPVCYYGPYAFAYNPEVFEAWFEIAKMNYLRDTLPPGEPSLFALLRMVHNETTEDEDFRTALNERTGWNLEDLETLMGEDGFNLDYPSDYQNEKALKQLIRFKQCFEIINVLGVSAEKIWKWKTPKITFEQAKSIRETVKAKYEEKQWLAVAKPLRDELRERQREALVAYVVHNMKELEIEDADDLFSYFLIDVEMSSCMLTSRIKQAISSVQLFVQRCLMNLEPEVTLTSENAKQWEWMKNYRVWEANRKVFLYPENWIEPELRDDKSPFFKDMENELLQNEVTVDTAEEAFKQYLEKLDEVKRLEISGMYYEVEQKSNIHTLCILHVFARTRGTPHIYYYRRWIRNVYLESDTYELIDDTYWTPWEQVDVDIEGNHLIPVVYNRRLHLFWPIFKEKVDEETVVLKKNQEEKDKRPKKYYEIQMAWSEYKDGKWIAKRISNEFVRTPSYPELPGKDRFRFYTFFTGNNDLVIAPEIYECATQSEGSWIFSTGNEISLTSPVIGNHETILSSCLSIQTRHLQQFRFIGCDKQIETGCHRFIRLNPIPGTYSWFMKFVEKNGRYNFQMFFDGEKATSHVWVRPWGDFVDEPWCSTAKTAYRMPYIDPAYKRCPFEYWIWWHTDSLLDETPGKFGVILPHQYRPFVPYIFYENFFLPIPFFYEDHTRTFLVTFKSFDLGPHWYYLYRFEPFYHPYVCLLISQLNRYGIDGLLSPNSHGETPKLRRQEIEAKYFKDEYDPTNIVDEPYPKDEFDFSYSGSYSLYNWELFFHAPFLIANHLSNNQRFAEAQKWYHYMFDPTDVSDDSYPEGFWKIKPFYTAESGQPIHELLLLLRDDDDLTSEEREIRKELVKQIHKWRANPFNPHLIARIRLVAYQKAIVMKYLNNLIAWGDHLFRQDTIETINEATQLYVLAAQILGKKPEDIPPPEGTRQINGKEVKTFEDLKDNLDEFSNALIQIETALSPSTEGYPDTFIDPFTYIGTTLQTSVVEGHLDITFRVNDMELLKRPMEQDYIFDDEVPTSSVIGPTLFFCIPRNDKLLSYWDTVADRLFKIRYCMTIEGVVRQLPLFQPPIEPGLLVRAAAAGVDIASALNDLYAPLPYYRFQVMLQRAVELCADVRNLGAALLSALEKRDAEELALLRSSHEVTLLKAVRQIKEYHIKEAEETLKALEKSKEAAMKRKKYYESREYMNAKERLHLQKLESARKWQTIGQGLELGAGALSLIPELDTGVSGPFGSPVVKARFGGSNLSSAVQVASRAMSLKASIETHEATKASIRGGFDRRMDDWMFQAEQAEKDIEHIEKQISAAEIRRAMAEQDLETHDLQTENAKEVDTFMRDKFTNKQLYTWMVSQLSTIYFQSYQMAYDLAKRAEKAFQHEIGDPNVSFVQFGYWDNLKKGLLSGEKLHYDLKRMETAYYDQNKREYEITKHISLAMLYPEALVMLKETGACCFNLPEAIFDLDYPGHYMRRIKSVSLTIPCVTGPYTNVSCTLVLQNNRIRQTTDTEPEYAWQDPDDPRFSYDVGGIQSIATSSAREDSGLFELNFRDERYLPFEGAGAISSWCIELPTEFKQFDYDTISDVVIHVQYTARDGGGNFKDTVKDHLINALNDMVVKDDKTGLFRLFSVKREFPNEWHQFLYSTGSEQKMELDLSKERFPFQFKDKKIQIKQLVLFIKLKDGTQYDENSPLKLSVVEDGTTKDDERDLTIIDGTLGNLPHAEWNYNGSPKNPGKWLLEVKSGTLDIVEDIGILCWYSVTE